MNKKTKEEIFWEGNFGSRYHLRNNHYDRSKIIGIDLKKNNIKIKNCIEIGANIGLNLNGVKKFYPNVNTYGIEINKKSFLILKEKHPSTNCSFGDFRIKEKFDLVISSGFLIHQNPKSLKKIYKKIYNLSKKYFYFSEYFSSHPISKPYRKHSKKLYMRDFASEFIDLNKKIKILDYGFHWSKDPKKKAIPIM